MTTKPIELVANIDLDGTLADFDRSMHEKMVAMQAPSEEPLQPGDLLDPDKVFPDYMEARMRSIKQQPGFWRELKPIALGMEVLDLIRFHGFNINILSKGPRRNPPAWAEKVEWIHRHVPNAHGITITLDKGLQYGRVLFDDWPPYILRWLEWRPRGHVLMLDHAGNRTFTHPQVLRVTKLEDLPKVSELLKKAKGEGEE